MVEKHNTQIVTIINHACIEQSRNEDTETPKNSIIIADTVFMKESVHFIPNIYSVMVIRNNLNKLESMLYNNFSKLLSVYLCRVVYLLNRQ